MTPQPPLPADPANHAAPAQPPPSPPPAPAVPGGSLPARAARPAATVQRSARALAQLFDDEITAAVSYERGLAVKAVLSLTFVALVLAARLLFFG